MLKCPNCGEENALGRVFCANCGTKLDLTQINEGEIEEMGKAGRWVSYWPFYAMGLGAVILGVVGLALWPIEGAVGDPGKRSDASMVRSQLSALRRITKGRMMEPQFTEKQLNGYLANYPGRKLGLPICSADIDGDIIKVRIVKLYGPFGTKGTQIPIKIMMEVDYKIEDAQLVPLGGALGHLPLPGPLGKIPHSLILANVADAEAWKSLEYVKDLSIEKGRLKIKVSR